MNEEKFITEKLPKLRRRCFNILEGYTPGEQPQNVEEWIKLNTNENPYPPPDQVKKDLQKAIEHRLRMYPDPTAKELRKAIVEKYVSQFDFDMYDNEENVLVANGSDETLDILFKTFIDQGDHVLYCTPSYGMYPVLAETYDAVKVVLPLNDEFKLDLEKIQFRKSDKLLILCSPNNPDGGIIPLDQLKTICNRFSGAVFVDEAYGDFADQTALEILPSCPNLIVGKTFSKSFGMASIRLGFAFAHKEIIKLFNTVRLPYNVSYMTQMAGISALNSWNKITDNIEKIKKERERLIGEVKDLDIRVLPTQSNFFLMEFESPERCSHIFNSLKERKILTRYWSSEELNRFIRVTVGTPEQNKKFLIALKDIISKD